MFEDEERQALQACNESAQPSDPHPELPEQLSKHMQCTICSRGHIVSILDHAHTKGELS